MSVLSTLVPSKMASNFDDAAKTTSRYDQSQDTGVDFNQELNSARNSHVSKNSHSANKKENSTSSDSNSHAAKTESSAAKSEETASSEEENVTIPQEDEAKEKELNSKLQLELQPVETQALQDSSGSESEPESESKESALEEDQLVVDQLPSGELAVADTSLKNAETHVNNNPLQDQVIEENSSDMKSDSDLKQQDQKHADVSMLNESTDSHTGEALIEGQNVLPPGKQTLESSETGKRVGGDLNAGVTAAADNSESDSVGLLSEAEAKNQSKVKADTSLAMTETKAQLQNIEDGQRAEKTSNTASLNADFELSSQKGSSQSANQSILETQSTSKPVEMSITKPVTTPDWGEKVFERIRWMASASQQKAEIRLDPPDLGPLKIEVSIKNDHAQVTMTSHSSVVREILDQHLPRLRDSLESQGFQTIDAQTRDGQKDSQSQSSQHAHGGAHDISSSMEEDGMQESTIIVEKSGKGRVDCYI